MNATRSPRVRSTERAGAKAHEGIDARKRAPRRGAAVWDARIRDRRALDRLRAQEAVRDPELLPLRYARMVSSPWAYLRGAAAVMAADLAKRLVTSVHVLVRSEGLDGSCSEDAATAAVDGYRRAMRRYARMGELDVWYDQITPDVPLGGLTSEFAQTAARAIEKKSRKQTHHGMAKRLVTEENGRRQIILDPMKRVDEGLDQDQRIRAYEQLYDTYLASIPPHLRRLVDRFTRTDSVRQIVGVGVGVGSVGMRVWLHLLDGESGRQPVFSQVKQATASVYEEFLGSSEFSNHGERIVVGQRLVQTAGDIFLGHMRVDGFDFYVRQFRDMKVVPRGKDIAGYLPQFAHACGQVLAKSHARSGDPEAIAAYIGRGDAFADGILRFGRAYARQTHEDHAELIASVAAGEVEVAKRAW